MSTVKWYTCYIQDILIDCECLSFSFFIVKWKAPNNKISLGKGGVHTPNHITKQEGTNALVETRKNGGIWGSVVNLHMSCLLDGYVSDEYPFSNKRSRTALTITEIEGA